MKQQTELKNPFFAKLLEAQKKEEQNQIQPTKPSLDMAQTQKWPSDGDDTIPPIEF